MLGKKEGKGARRLLVPFLIFVIVFGAVGIPLFALTMFYSIGVGEAGLLVDPIMHTISEPVLGPTWGPKAPWVSVKTIYYATDVYEDEIPCFSRYQLEMKSTGLMR